MSKGKILCLTPKRHLDGYIDMLAHEGYEMMHPDRVIRQDDSAFRALAIDQSWKEADAILLDPRTIPGEEPEAAGLDLLSRIRRAGIKAPVIVLSLATNIGDVEKKRFETINKGCEGTYIDLRKPDALPEHLTKIISDVIAHSKSEKQVAL